MISDPYKVLEVSPNADNDEIKKAYRRLIRIYHPDANINNPNKDQAERKFKEVQDAYDQIIKEREDKERAYSSNYGGFEYQYQGQESVEMQAVYNFINTGHFVEALHVLENMTDRNARWYYVTAIVHASMGNNLNAAQFARQAVNMEPNNAEYRNFLSRLEYRSQWYQNMGRGYERPTVNLGSCCCEVLCIQTLCRCCFFGGF